MFNTFQKTVMETVKELNLQKISCRVIKIENMSYKITIIIIQNIMIIKILNQII